MKTANAPLFKDPIHNGAADPVVIYNEETGTHYMLYTARRADVEEEGVMWVHGTDIGIAESKDNGNSWEYIGICKGLEYGEGKNTYWAPEVIRFGELYHMYVSYVPGIPADWNHPRHILHYTSKNLIDWNLKASLTFHQKKLLTLVYSDYRTVFSECGTRTSETALIHILPTARTYIIGKLKAVPPMTFRTKVLMYLNLAVSIGL